MKTKIVIAILLLGLLLPETAYAEFGGLPSGFTDVTVVDGIPNPTAFAWLPDRDLLITSKGGVLFRLENGATDSDQVLDLSNAVCSGSEMGLLGVAVDPNFNAGSPFIYLYYTDRQGNGGCDPGQRANRVSRFTVDSSGGIGNEQVLIDNILALGGNHNGGDLQFGKDGLLYVAVGDGGRDFISGASQDDNANARSLSLLNGKILRIAPDGSIPAGNPFTGNNTARCAETGRAPSTKGGASAQGKKRQQRKHKQKQKKRKKQKLKKKRRQLRNASTCQEIFATGLRNPFRIAFDPDDGPNDQRLFINDVGGSAWEEIDDAVAGADYGWNVREGPCPTGQTNGCSPSNRFVEPFFAYQHGGGCGTITGGAFVPDGVGWGAFSDDYLYADFNCGRLFTISDISPGAEADEFGSGGNAVHLAFGPDGDLYYADFFAGEVRKIQN